MLNKKMIVLLGLAGAYLGYRYSQMSADEKDALKEKGRKLIEDYVPQELKDLLSFAGKDGKKTDPSFNSPM